MAWASFVIVVRATAIYYCRAEQRKERRAAGAVAQKKSPASGAPRYCAETGGVLFRDFGVAPDLRPAPPMDSILPLSISL